MAREKRRIPRSAGKGRTKMMSEDGDVIISPGIVH
jgi:hypothetical protein